MSKQNDDRRGRGRRYQRANVIARFLWVALVMASAVLLVRVARRPSGPDLVISVAETSEATNVRARTTRRKFPVHVDGAVASPGVYTMADGAIVHDAIERAGGLSLDADVTHINLAERLTPHMKVYVPREGEPPPVQARSDGTAEPARVDLNRATVQELLTLPGIGPATADAIVRFRSEHGPFESIEDIMRVPGIKEGRFERLRDRLTVTVP